MKIAIIIPTYNEAENISSLLKEIFNLGLDNLEIIVVDDNSPDGTAKIVTELKKKYPALQLLSRPKKMGLGHAYRQGFTLAFQQGAEIVMEIDADHSHDPQVIPQFITTVEQGHPAVIGSRRIPGGQIIGWNSLRHLYSWGAITLARIVLNLQTKDITSGYRAFNKKALEAIKYQEVTSNGYAFQVEMVYHLEKKGFQPKEIPIVFKDRQRGRSKLAFKDAKEFFHTLWRLRFKADDFN